MEATILENQMEKKMENEMETGVTYNSCFTQYYIMLEFLSLEHAEVGFMAYNALAGGMLTGTLLLHVR